MRPAQGESAGTSWWMNPMEVCLPNINKAYGERTSSTARKSHLKINVSEVRDFCSLPLPILFPPSTQSNRRSSVGEGLGETVSERNRGALSGGQWGGMMVAGN